MSFLYSYNSTKRVNALNKIAGATFTDKLNNAISFLSEGGTLDLSDQGDATITSTIVINKKLNFIWPSSVFTFTGAAGTDMFSFEASNISFLGTGRSAKASERADVTLFDMTSGRYHIYSRGNSQLTLKGFDCEGVASGDLETFGNHALQGELSGSGGIYVEKPNPGTVSGGNTISGIYIGDIYIEKTYAHGIYLDTPILAKVENVRTSTVRGFGFFQKGGTSTTFERCFSASAYQGGFLFDAAAYTSIIGCASETAGIGYWIRSCQGFSAFASGAESCKNVGASVPGVLLETLADDNVTVVEIDDVSSDFENRFRGTSWLISGGQGIVLQAPFSTNIGKIYDSGTTNTCRHFLVSGNTRGLTIINPRVDINSGSTVENRFDWEFDQLGADVPSDIKVIYDPSDGTIVPLHTSYFTSNNLAGESTYVKTDTNDVVFEAGVDIFDPVTNPGVTGV